MPGLGVIDYLSRTFKLRLSFAAVPCPFGFNLHCPFYAQQVVTEAGPLPALRLFHQTALYRVAVHVAQLLDMLSVGQHVEVMVTTLPELLAPVLALLRDLRLEHVQRCGQPVALWLRDQ